MANVNELVKRISESCELNEQQIMQKVLEKEEELAGLISLEGACQIVAKELGINLMKRTEHKLDISSIIPGMKNVDVTAKILEISPVREFKTERAEGKVANVLLADESGTIRLSLWNDELAVLEQINKGDTIRIHGFVREQPGRPAGQSVELRIGKYGRIFKSDEVIDVEETAAPMRAFGLGEAGRRKISELTEGSRAELRGAILQVFETNTFYNICPECERSVKEEAEGNSSVFKCKTHGTVEPKKALVVSGIIDDGYGNMRITAFRESAEQLLHLNTEEAWQLFLKKADKRAPLKNVELGKEFVVNGRVKKNDFFDRLEFIVDRVHDVDVLEEINGMME